MTADRLELNTPDTWTGPDHALGLVDEVVVSNCAAHFEMCDETAGYLAIYRDGQTLFCRVYARATTRDERRRIRAAGERAPMAVLCVQVEENDLVPDEAQS